MEADFSKGLGGLGDEVAGFLDAQVTEVFLGRHIKGGFEFSKEAAERKPGGFGEVSDRDIFPVVLIKESEGWSELFVFCERGGALIEGAGDANDPADFALLIDEGLLGGGGPIDEAVSARDELDPIDDGFSGF